MNNEQTWLVFDTETTDLVGPNLKPINKQPRIIEFAGILAIIDENGNVNEIDTIDTLVNPGFDITPEITKITGIKPEQLIDQPTFKDIAGDVEDFLNSAQGYVGHNLMFDVRMLKFEFQRIDPMYLFPSKLLACTSELSEHEIGRRSNLTDTYQLLCGKAHTGAHRAMADVRVTLGIFQEIRKRKVI